MAKGELDLFEASESRAYATKGWQVCLVAARFIREWKSGFARFLMPQEIEKPIEKPMQTSSPSKQQLRELIDHMSDAHADAVLYLC